MKEIDQSVIPSGSSKIFKPEDFSFERIIRISAVATVFLSLLAAPYFQIDDATRPFMGTMNGLVLSALFVFYMVAAKLYKDTFYFLIGIGWLMVAIQIFFQVANINNPHGSEYYFIVGGLSFASNIFSYIGSLIPKNHTVTPSRVAVHLAVWLFIIAIPFAAGIYFFGSSDLGYIFLIAQTPFSIWTLFRIGVKIEERLHLEVFSKSVFLLSASFYLFGIYQLATLVISWSPETRPYLVFVSLLIKIINVLCIYIVMNRDYGILREQLIQRNVFEELGYLAAGIEHDIRNPLGLLKMRLDEMKQTSQNDRRMLGFITFIEEQMRRIKSAADIVVDIRGGADSYKPLLEKTRVRDVILSSILTVKSFRDLDTSRITFTTDCSKDIYAKLHNNLFKDRVMINILKNAVEAINRAKPSKGQIEIECCTNSQTPPKIMITISDNGCGVKQENIPKLPTIFTTKVNTPNSGNGLFLSDKVIKMHRGEWDVESVEGEKTTVTILLPTLETQEIN